MPRGPWIGGQELSGRWASAGTAFRADDPGRSAPATEATGGRRGAWGQCVSGSLTHVGRKLRWTVGRENSDEYYVLDLLDSLLGTKSRRGWIGIPTCNQPVEIILARTTSRCPPYWGFRLDLPSGGIYEPSSPLQWSANRPGLYRRRKQSRLGH